MKKSKFQKEWERVEKRQGISYQSINVETDNGIDPKTGECYHKPIISIKIEGITESKLVRIMKCL